MTTQRRSPIMVLGDAAEEFRIKSGKMPSRQQINQLAEEVLGDHLKAEIAEHLGRLEALRLAGDLNKLMEYVQEMTTTQYSCSSCRAMWDTMSDHAFAINVIHHQLHHKFNAATHAFLKEHDLLKNLREIARRRERNVKKWGFTHRDLLAHFLVDKPTPEWVNAST